MTTSPGDSQQSLTELVAAEIRATMGRRAVRQSQLARVIEVTEQWLSVRLRGVQPIDVNDLAVIAAGLGVTVTDLLPEAARQILDVEVIKSRPMRSRPARHPRSAVKPTHDYPSRPVRTRPADPNSRPPNGPGAGRPKGRPEKSRPDPATRRPSRLPSATLNMIGPSRSPSGNYPATASHQGRTALPVRSLAERAKDSRHD